VVAPNVLVAGASVPGLCLAHGLRKRGVPVTVYERGDGIRVDGPRTLLRIDSRAHAGLATCLPADVYDQCLELRNALDDALLTHYDSQLREVLSVEAAQMGSTTADTVVDQDWLRKVLLTGVADHVRFGRAVTGYRERPDGIDARFADGAEAHGDVLVLADGRHSVARDTLIPDFELLDIGLDAIHGHTALDPGLFDQVPRDVLLQQRPILGPQRGAMVLCAYLPQALARSGEPHDVDLAGVRGYLKWTSVLPSRPGLTDGGPAVLRRIVMEQIAWWHPAVRQLLERSDDRRLFAAPIQASAPLQRRRPGLATALGAAARVVPSVGVLADGIALHDAGRLAVGIHENPQLAVACHEERMLDEGNTVVGQALGQIERTFSL
jgi:2-polyprenyl-6-methoxyphenol hydroxylase-like FAD-dependent oxidoreductase